MIAITVAGFQNHPGNGIIVGLMELLQDTIPNLGIEQCQFFFPAETCSRSPYIRITIDVFPPLTVQATSSFVLSRSVGELIQKQYPGKSVTCAVTQLIGGVWHSNMPEQLIAEQEEICLIN